MEFCVRCFRRPHVKLLSCIFFLATMAGAQGPLRVRIEARELTATPVSKLLYGNFIESGFGRQVDGMWAEMLYNRSFESIPPKRGWLNQSKGEDHSTKPWWHSGYEENEWRLAPGNSEAALQVTPFWGFHHGKQGARISNPSADRNAVLVQEGIFLRAGIQYRFRGYVRSGRDLTITVGLYREGDLRQPLAEKQVALRRGDWNEVTAEFPNAVFRGRATFGLTAPPASELSADDFSLMPADNLGGWRKDVVEALRKVRPGIIRFPGGCYASAFNWRDGVGPRSDRQPRISDFWGGLEYNDAGTDEFLQLCRMIGAEPFLVMNMMTGSPGDAADWVAYCNAPASHPMGALRARNGHAEPYGVRYWELDNETYRKWSPAEYARECIRYAEAARAVDRSLRFVAVGYGQFAKEVRTIVAIAGGQIDFISDRAKGEKHLEDQLGILKEYNRRAGRSVRLTNTEWLAPWEEVPPDSALPGGMLIGTDKDRRPLQEKQIRWRYAMNAARTLLMFQRFGGDFEFANFNNMANTWGQNVVECPKEEAFLSAVGRVFELYTTSGAAWPLALEPASPASGVHAQAAWDRDRKNLVLDLLNFGEQPVDLNFDASALPALAGEADVRVLFADSLMAHNTPAQREAIRREDSRGKIAAGGQIRIAARPFSITQAIVRLR